MKDISERLRTVGEDYDFHGNALIFEAADEIERLRAQLAAPDVQGEPVAWSVMGSNGSIHEFRFTTDRDRAEKWINPSPGNVLKLVPLYAAPQPAPDVQGDPVGWQFYQHGEWWNGDDRIKDHRKNTEEAGFPVRDVYAHPQPASDVSALPDALMPASPDIEYLRNVSHGNSIPALLRGNIMSALRWIDTLQTRLAHPQPSPDVSALVEAITELCDEIDKHEIHAAISKTSISWFKRKARKALAVYRQGGEV